MLKSVSTKPGTAHYGRITTTPDRVYFGLNEAVNIIKTNKTKLSVNIHEKIPRYPKPILGSKMFDKRLLNPVSSMLISIGDFLNQPLTSFYRGSNQKLPPSFSLGLTFSRTNCLIQLAEKFPISNILPRHDWLTCFEPEEHLSDLSARIARVTGINVSSRVGGFSFKDDSILAQFRSLGHDPVFRVGEKNRNRIKNLPDHAAFYADYSEQMALEFVQKNKRLDVLIVRHIVEHSYDIEAFLRSLKILLDPNGYIVIEVPDCGKALEAGDCTLLWEEHTSYFTPLSLRSVFMASGFRVIDEIRYPYEREDSLVLIVKPNPVGAPVIPGFNEEELKRELNRAIGFSALVHERKNRVRRLLENFHSRFGEIAIFGAGHLSFTFVSVMGLNDLIKFYVDDNPNKLGLFPSFGDTPIVPSSKINKSEIALCLLGSNPGSHAAIEARHASFLKDGGIFASIFTGSERYVESILGNFRRTI